MAASNKKDVTSFINIYEFLCVSPDATEKQVSSDWWKGLTLYIDMRILQIDTSGFSPPFFFFLFGSTPLALDVAIWKNFFLFWQNKVAE
jgi:hypothetical protein